MSFLRFRTSSLTRLVRHTLFHSIKLEWKQRHPPIFYIVNQLITQYPRKKPSQQSRETISHGNYTTIFEKPKCRTVKGKVLFGDWFHQYNKYFAKEWLFLHANGEKAINIIQNVKIENISLIFKWNYICGINICNGCVFLRQNELYFLNIFRFLSLAI